MCIVLAGASRASLGADASSPSSSSFAKAQLNYRTLNYGSDLVAPVFDCSKIHELGIDKQVGLRAGAIMVFCGAAHGGEPDVGAFDYASAIAGKHLTSWTDGRVAISNTSQQDAFFDQDQSVAVTPTPIPTPRPTPTPRSRPTPAPRPQ